MAKKQTPLPPGTEFTSRSERDIEQFKAARTFSVTVFKGCGVYENTSYPNYPLAMWICLHTERGLLYAIAEGSGQGMLIPESEFEFYLKLYNQLTGHKYYLPPEIKERIASRSKERIKAKHGRRKSTTPK